MYSGTQKPPKRARIGNPSWFLEGFGYPNKYFGAPIRILTIFGYPKLALAIRARVEWGVSGFPNSYFGAQIDILAISRYSGTQNPSKRVWIGNPSSFGGCGYKSRYFGAPIDISTISMFLSTQNP